MGCCGSRQAQGPVGLKIALPAAGMTQTAFFSHTAGPSRVGLSVAEHQRPPRLLYFKQQGLIRGLIGTVLLAGERGGIKYCL